MIKVVKENNAMLEEIWTILATLTKNTIEIELSIQVSVKFTSNGFRGMLKYIYGS